MNKKYSTDRKKLFLALLPILVLLSVAVLMRSDTYSENLIADEAKFYVHAKNITNGYYSQLEDPNFKEGPGYPLYLSIPAVFDIPYSVIRASNILLLFFAYCYFFLILRRYVKRRPALILTYLFALYPPMLRWANLMYAESLMLLLLLGFCYHFIRWYNREGKYKRHLLLSIVFLGFLALTKIIFAYVIVVALIGACLFLLFPRFAKTYQLKRTLLVFLGALVLFSPYVAYSYHITNKFFYLGMHGGTILYFRSTPFENEFGNSFSSKLLLNKKGPVIRKSVNVNIDQLYKNHNKIFTSIDTLSWIEKDSVLKAKAIENIKKHPKKYVRNTVANISRIFFHYPFSYRIQNLDTLGYLIPNMFIVVLALFGIYPAFIRRKKIPKELIILMFFSLIYLGGHILLGGRGRFLIPVVPIWMMFFSFIYLRVLKIRIKDSKSIQESVHGHKPDEV